MKLDFRFPISGLALVVVLLISTFLLFGSPVLAKGNFPKIVVSGGNLIADIEITDPALLGFFSLSDFANARTDEPRHINLSDGYIVSRGGEENGIFKAWDRLFYYPNRNGTGGYVYYEGLINGWSEYDGKWYMASAEGDSAMRRLIGIAISPPQWPSHPPRSGYYAL